MKERFGFAGATAAIFVCTLFGLARGWADSPPASFNVKDFGVKGDGRTDDTEALQRAFDEAAKIGIPEILLPPGDYLIFKPLVPKVSVRGPATIWQKNPEEDTFYSEYAHHISFESLILRGGRTILNLAN